MRIELRYDDAAARAALQKAPGVVRARLGEAVETGAALIARDARGRVPKAFSHLRNSILHRRESDLHWVVSPAMNYARMVEEGRKPGRMPGTRNGLLEWVRLKLAPAADGKALDRIGFAVARAIGRHGIKPQPYMAPALEAQRPRVIDLANAAMRKAVEEINGAR